MPILKRSTLQHDKSEIRRSLIKLADQLSTHAGVLCSVLGHENANSFDRTAKDLCKKLTAAQQPCFNGSGGMLSLNQVKI